MVELTQQPDFSHSIKMNWVSTLGRSYALNSEKEKEKFAHKQEQHTQSKWLQVYWVWRGVQSDGDQRPQQEDYTVCVAQ